VQRYEDQGRPLPLGSLFLQVGRAHPGARAIVAELLRQENLAAGIRVLQHAGLVPASVDVAPPGGGAAGRDPGRRVDTVSPQPCRTTRRQGAFISGHAHREWPIPAQN
jgi:hypothetical protein